MKAELYGHYDSRGGAVIYTCAREEADEKYNSFFGSDDPGILEAWGDWRPSIEDHLGTIEIEVRDGPEGNEDLVYADEGGIRLWADADEWRGELSELRWVISRESPGVGWHVAEFLGEDAFGCIWNME